MENLLVKGKLLSSIQYLRKCMPNPSFLTSDALEVMEAEGFFKSFTDEMDGSTEKMFDFIFSDEGIGDQDDDSLVMIKFALAFNAYSLENHRKDIRHHDCIIKELHESFCIIEEKLRISDGGMENVSNEMLCIAKLYIESASLLYKVEKLVMRVIPIAVEYLKYIYFEMRRGSFSIIQEEEEDENQDGKEEYNQEDEEEEETKENAKITSLTDLCGRIYQFLPGEHSKQSVYRGLEWKSFSKQVQMELLELHYELNEEEELSDGGQKLSSIIRSNIVQQEGISKIESLIERDFKEIVSELQGTLEVSTGTRFCKLNQKLIIALSVFTSQSLLITSLARDNMPLLVSHLKQAAVSNRELEEQLQYIDRVISGMNLIYLMSQLDLPRWNLGFIGILVEIYHSCRLLSKSITKILRNVIHSADCQDEDYRLILNICLEGRFTNDNSLLLSSAIQWDYHHEEATRQAVSKLVDSLAQLSLNQDEFFSHLQRLKIFSKSNSIDEKQFISNTALKFSEISSLDSKLQVNILELYCEIISGFSEHLHSEIVYNIIIDLFERFNPSIFKLRNFLALLTELCSCGEFMDRLCIPAFRFHFGDDFKESDFDLILSKLITFQIVERPNNSQFLKQFQDRINYYKEQVNEDDSSFFMRLLSYAYQLFRDESILDLFTGGTDYIFDLIKNELGNGFSSDDYSCERNFTIKAIFTMLEDLLDRDGIAADNARVLETEFSRFMNRAKLNLFQKSWGNRIVGKIACIEFHSS